MLRAADRYASEASGIQSWHCFSAGAHYDANNVAFGTLVGVDEHLLDPGAAFDRHPHRGVAIVTWVLEGALRHQDDTGATHVVEPGVAAVQIAGPGVQHVEANASDVDPVRFVQTTVLCDDDEPSYRLASPPVLAGPALFDVRRSGPLVIESARSHLYVAEGRFGYDKDGIGPGDSLRVTAAATFPMETPTLYGDGQLLVTLLR